MPRLVPRSAEKCPLSNIQRDTDRVYMRQLRVITRPIEMHAGRSHTSASFTMQMNGAAAEIIIIIAITGSPCCSRAREPFVNLHIDASWMEVTNQTADVERAQKRTRATPHHQWRAAGDYRFHSTHSYQSAFPFFSSSFLFIRC